MFFQMVVKKLFSLQNVTRGPVGLTRIASLTLSHLGDFGTSTAWGGESPPPPPRYFLCSLSYVNQIWYVAIMSKNDLKCGKNCNFFSIMAS